MSADRRSCAATLHSRPGANRRPTESLRGEPVADSGPRCNQSRRSDDDPATIILDLYTATTAALQTTPRLIVIDLAGVGFLGAKGVRAVVEAKARASSLDIPLRLAGGNAFSRRLLRICGDDAALDHFPTAEGALAGQDPR